MSQRQFRQSVVDQLNSAEPLDEMLQIVRFPWPDSWSFRPWVLPSSRRVRTPTILQMEAAECGAAALAIVFAHHRLFLPLEKIREECGVSRDGTTAAKLLMVARKHGFQASGFRKEPEELAALPLPIIIHWNFDHFVVLEGIDENQVWMNDPARGRRVVTRAEFDRYFTGPVLVLKPGKSFQSLGSPPQVISILLEWVSGSRQSVVFLVIVGICLVVPGLVVPLLSRTFVDEILGSGRESLLAPLLIGMLITALCRGVLTWLHRDSLSKLAHNLVKTLSFNYLQHAMKLPYSFYLARHPGDVAARVEIGDRLSWLLSGDLPAVALSALMAIFFVIMMFVMEPQLTFLVLLFAGAALLIDRLGAARRAEKASQVTHEHARWMSMSMAGLQTIETLKANGIESRFFEKWASQQARVATAQQSLALHSECLSAPARYLHSISTISVLGIGATKVMSGEITVGTLVAFQSLMASFLGPLALLAGFAGQIDMIRAQVARFRDVLDHPLDSISITDPEQTGCKDDELLGHVEFQKVAFGYNPLSPPSVIDLSFSIPSGHRVAIVGRTGSGKSTIARLLTGLLLPREGEILFDGKTRQSISPDVLTSSIASVEQDIHLFEGTIAENLTLWDSSIPREDMLCALHDACLDRLIANLPSGLETRLTEGGRNFSGGERQRFEIARALVRKPAILVLDEATSALDAETERRLYERLRCRGCTCIIVAHRLSAIRDSDEILVLDSGRVVERGRHEDLWRMEGLYQKLIQTE